MIKAFVEQYTTISNIVALWGNSHRITLLIVGKAKVDSFGILLYYANPQRSSFKRETVQRLIHQK